MTGRVAHGEQGMHNSSSPGAAFVLTRSPAIAAFVALAATACTSHPTGPTGPALSLSTLSHDFGGIPVGSRSQPFAFSVANRSEAASGILAIAIGGPNAAEFALVRDQCTGQEVQEVASCALEIELRPSSTGPKQATLTVIDPHGPDVSAFLGGSGADAGLAIAPASQAFEATTVGTASTVRTIVVRNTIVQPTGSIRIEISGTHPADFQVTRDTCTDQSLPLGGTCVLDIRFAPGAAGARQAAVTVSASPGGSVATQLSGVGTT